MRTLAVVLVALVAMSIVVPGCGEKPIGQPCIFHWSKKIDGSYNCENKYPECHPLQDRNDSPLLNNKACPVDCIQMPSLECENLICVASQIQGNYTNMNGVCFIPGEEVGDCPGANVACMGYCTKECLTDASCPKEYRCSAMAPYGTTLNCEDEQQWGTKCTDDCRPAGSGGCPGSGKDADYGLCDQEDYADCCACICYKYCSLSSKKFCRLREWNQDRFKDAVVAPGTSCGQN